MVTYVGGTGNETLGRAATGISCRVEALPSTTTSATTTISTPTIPPDTTPTTNLPPVTTTAAAGPTCPLADESYCSCGRVKSSQLPSRSLLPLSTPNRIVGGQETVPHKYPWHVGVSYNGVMFCGASLIARRHVLTAAHCVEYLKAMSYQISGVKVSGKKITQIYF